MRAELRSKSLYSRWLLGGLLVTASLGMGRSPDPAPSPAVSPATVQKVQAAAPKPQAELGKWCSELASEIKKYKWSISPCPEGVEWKVGGTSVQGRPLVYAEFGNPNSSNVSLILSAVHGDEITPVYVGIQLVHWLKQNQGELKDFRVVIAPLVNPDGFYRKPPTRMNARGVDVNRNFGTKDWPLGAKKWKTAFRSDPRRNPGSASRSEPETLFQEALITMVKPQKIMSVHAPLNHLDYDGPSALQLSRFPREYIHASLKLRKELKAKSTGYFPGSLGNYAGHELGIPTLTLELPSADPTQAEAYWRKFSEGIRTMIEYSMPPNLAWQDSDAIPLQQSGVRN